MTARVLDTADPWAALLYASTRAVATLARLARARERDGWRAAAEVFHQADLARYVLCVPGLEVPAEPVGAPPGVRLAAAVRSVLRRQPHAHFALEARGAAVRRVPWAHGDVLLATYAADDTLVAVDLAGADANEEDHLLMRAVVAPALVAAYARHRHHDGRRRVRRLQREVLDRVVRAVPTAARPRVRELALRALRAAWLDLEPSTGEPVTAPTFLRRPPAGPNVLSLHCVEHGARRFDLTCRVSHIGLDGYPAIGLVRELARALRRAPERPLTPAAPLYTGRVEVGRGEVVLERGVCAAASVGAAKRRLDAALVAAGEEPALWSAVWAWLVTSHPLFADAKVCCPVALDLDDPARCSLGYVVLRPRTYRRDGRGLGPFCRDFLAETRLAQQRRGATSRFLADGAFVPAWAVSGMPFALRRRVGELTGSVCVAVLEHVDAGWELLTDSLEAMIAVPARPTRFVEGPPGYPIAATARRPAAGRVIDALQEVTRAAATHLALASATP